MGNAIVPASLFLANLRSCKGIPYKWGGKDPHGLDCSGLVTYAYLMSGGEDITQYWNCARLIKECQEVKGVDVKPACLAFYGFSAKAPDHVMAVIETSTGGSQTAYGACGGNHYCLTPADALKMKAKVQERPQIAYRHDFLGTFKWERLDYSA